MQKFHGYRRKTSARGQIVIPKDIRRQMKITPGKKSLLKVEGDRALIQPLPDDSVEEFCGVFSEQKNLLQCGIPQKGDYCRPMYH